MKNFDIIIIGAGPGGSVAAKVASENGYSTCILEKEMLGEKGRYKACGGATAWELIEEIDYPEEKIGRVIESLELHLTDMAVDSGALLKEKELMINIEKVDDFYKISTNKDKYTAKYIIAADGVTSPTLKLLNWPFFKSEDLILTITKEMKTNKSNIDKVLGHDTVHLFFGIESLIRVGYAWLFPKTERITVGWGNQINLVKNSREEFKKFLALPLVKLALNNSTMETYKPHLIPVGLRSKLYENNVFAIGDAGGIVDPISGKGIPYAMMSGQFAIEAIKTCEERDKLDKLGSVYERNLDKKFLRVLKVKRILRDKIFQSDENLKKFLSLWENHRSSEIAMKKLMEQVSLHEIY
jgi:flavin-dependent dehydrogenase